MCAVHTGPMSSAHTTIEPDSGRNWKVKYMPTEVGVYNINLAWNDVEVDGKSLSSLEKYHQALSCDGNRHCVILAHSVKHPGDCCRCCLQPQCTRSWNSVAHVLL